MAMATQHDLTRASTTLVTTTPTYFRLSDSDRQHIAELVHEIYCSAHAMREEGLPPTTTSPSLEGSTQQTTHLTGAVAKALALFYQVKGLANRIGQEGPAQLAAIKQQLEAKVAALFVQIKHAALTSTATLKNKIIEVIDLLTSNHRVLQIVGVALTILVLGFTPPHISALLIQAVQGTALIYQATRATQLPQTGVETQDVEEEPLPYQSFFDNPIQGLVDSTMTPKQKSATYGTTMIAGAILTSGILSSRLADARIQTFVERVQQHIMA